MKIIRSQNLHYTIPITEIRRTTIEKKEEGCWLITATCDRPVTLARYPTETDAITADTLMWLSDDPIFTFPVYGAVGDDHV